MAEAVPAVTESLFTDVRRALRTALVTAGDADTVALYGADAEAFFALIQRGETSRFGETT